MSDTNRPENTEENDLFYFESDHLALRGNKDYSELLKAMFVLEAQREQAIKDYNQVVEIKKQCLEDPQSCIEKLKAGTLGIPEMQRLIEVPKIQWSKFNIKIPEQFIKQINCDKLEIHREVKHETKAGNSKPWTSEEQRKLEQLLIKYPSEDVESRRIKKIAKELGTRTHKQVASRLQKYYLKLIEAGLPVPGRLPKNKNYDKKVFGKKQYKYQCKKPIKPSTFFPELDIPVVMNETEVVPGPSNSQIPANSSNYLLVNNYHEDKPHVARSDSEIQLELLKRIKEEKLIEGSVSSSHHFQHFGYKCDYCEQEPVEGSRWHCSTCLSDSIDYCTDCMLSQLYSNTPHPLHHKIIIIRNDKVILDVTESDDSESVTGSSLQNGGDNSSNDSSSEDEIKSEINEELSNESQKLTFSKTNDYNFEVSESCPSNIFETNDVYVNGAKFTETQEVSYDYLHSNLLLDDS